MSSLHSPCRSIFSNRRLRAGCILAQVVGRFKAGAFLSIKTLETQYFSKAPPIYHPQPTRPFITMAWTCSGRTNTELIEKMWSANLITDPRVKAAFLKVDRAQYSPRNPYEDSPQTIGYSATISAPHMHASACEHLLPSLIPDPKISSPKRVLDVGSGSGYLTHILAELAGDDALVVGLEHIRELKELGEGNMGKSDKGNGLLNSGGVRFRVGDGRLGWTEEGKADWDVIHVGASAKEVHTALLEQLRAPGCLFIPVDDDDSGYSQHVWKIRKDEQGSITREKLFGVRYVPLTNAPQAS